MGTLTAHEAGCITVKPVKVQEGQKRGVEQGPFGVKCIIATDLASLLYAFYFYRNRHLFFP